MKNYIRLKPEQLPLAAEWIANINKIDRHHCGYCGTEASDIFATLNEDFFRNDSTTIVAQFDQDKLVGLIGFDTDDDTAEVWGPFHTSESVSESLGLWNFAQQEFLEIKKFSFFLHAKNTIHKELMTELGANFRGTHYYYVRSRKDFEEMPDDLIQMYNESDSQILKEMHSNAFPDTYYDTSTLINRNRHSDHLLLLAKINSKTIGYAYAEKDPNQHTAHLEYISIAFNFRGQGYGTRWLNEVLAEIFRDERIHKVTLTVSSNNEIANPLYEKVGFSKENELKFYQLNIK